MRGKCLHDEKYLHAANTLFLCEDVVRGACRLWPPNVSRTSLTLPCCPAYACTWQPASNCRLQVLICRVFLHARGRCGAYLVSSVPLLRKSPHACECSAEYLLLEATRGVAAAAQGSTHASLLLAHCKAPAEQAVHSSSMLPTHMILHELSMSTSCDIRLAWDLSKG